MPELNLLPSKINPSDTDILPIQQVDGTGRKIAIGDLLSGVRSDIGDLQSDVAALQGGGGSGGGGGSLAPWQIVTDSYTAAAGSRILLNSTTQKTITPPASPTTGSDFYLTLLTGTPSALIALPSGTRILRNVANLNVRSHWVWTGAIWVDITNTARPNAGLDLNLTGATVSDWAGGTVSSGANFSNNLLTFSGGQIVTISNSLTLSGDYTISTRFQWTAINAAASDFTPSNQYLFDIGGNDRSLNYYRGNWQQRRPDGSILVFGNFVPTVGSWYDIELKRVSNTLTLKIGGNTIGSGTCTGTMMAGTIRIGNFTGGGSYGLQGNMSSFLISTP